MGVPGAPPPASERQTVIDSLRDLLADAIRFIRAEIDLARRSRRESMTVCLSEAGGGAPGTPMSGTSDVQRRDVDVLEGFGSRHAVVVQRLEQEENVPNPGEVDPV